MWKSFGAGCMLAVEGKNALKDHAIFREGALKSGHFFSVPETKGKSAGERALHNVHSLQ